MKMPFRLLGVAFVLLGGVVNILHTTPAQAGVLGIAPAAPSGLSASVHASGNDYNVDLTWQPVARALFYRVERNGSSYALVLAPNFDDVHAVGGARYTYAITAIAWPYGESTPSPSISVLIAVAPAAPNGLTANGLWAASISKPEIQLGWQPVSGAQSYTIYRNGSPLSGITATTYTDSQVTSGTTYTYTVAASGVGGTSATSASASALAPNAPAPVVTTPVVTTPVVTTPVVTPPMSSMPTMPVTTTLTAPVTTPTVTTTPVTSTPAVATPAGFTCPTNLEVHGFWSTAAGACSDVLNWDPVPGATSYNVYQYNTEIAKGVTGTSYTVPFSQWNPSMTYTVTAYNGATGTESIPSAITMAQGAQNPAVASTWDPGPPPVPTDLAATTDWNGGSPRILLSWQGNGQTDYTYNVYRDGTEIASGVWRLVYIDNNVKPGSTHTYTVTGVNVPWTTSQESAQCAPVTETALSAQPAPSITPVQIVSLLPDSDSCLATFAAVPGAVDYRVFDVTNPGSVKYSGGSLSIEMNNLTPGVTSTLVVQALDKMGPFQTSDGVMGPGSMLPSGAMDLAINGQGDPSDLPNVIASSAPFTVTPVSQALTGQQAFFDDFMNDTPFEPATLSPALAAVSAANGTIEEVQNNNWEAYIYGADDQMSSIFIMDHHFMDTLYDGPTAATTSFSHNNNASMVIMPKATANIAGGKVLHVTFEVDPHFDGRRWVDVFVTAAGQPLTCTTPTKLNPGQALTPDDEDFYWQIQDQTCDAELIQPQSPGSNYAVLTDLFDLANGVGADDSGPGVRTTWAGDPVLNGTVQDLDKRHKFDLYLSQTHFRVTETILGQPTVVVKDETFPNGMTIPFTDCQVSFVHELYHTENDRQERITYYGKPASYWYNNRPWADERHWDDMGFEVLNSFPTLPSAN